MTDQQLWDEDYHLWAQHPPLLTRYLEPQRNCHHYWLAPLLSQNLSSPAAPNKHYVGQWIFVKTMRWEGHLAWDEEYTETFKLTDHLLKFRHRWRDNIKIRLPGFNPVWGFKEQTARKLGSTIIYSWGSRLTASQGLCCAIIYPTVKRRVETMASIKDAHH
jgi:hypothetical protein